jgi:hypothetical protein
MNSHKPNPEYGRAKQLSFSERFPMVISKGMPGGRHSIAAKKYSYILKPKQPKRNN